jgi:hypothetical protein
VVLHVKYVSRSRYQWHISEHQMEMHYHHAIINHWRLVYGGLPLRLFKPSPRKEAWVAFDQAWVRTELSTTEFMGHLKDAIRNERERIDRFYLGYFLQFKNARQIKRRSTLIPSGYTVPYWRVDLYVTPLPSTQLSQHEILRRLGRIDYASVCYACSMSPEFFDVNSDPDLKNLRCVDIRTAPADIGSWVRQFLTFQSADDHGALWNPTRVPGTSYGFNEWAAPNSPVGPKKLSAAELMTLIQNASDEMGPLQEIRLRGKAISLPSSFTVVEIKKNS